MGAVRHRFTVEEYRKMGEVGIFSEDDRVELIDGEVVEMAPIGWRHALCVTRLTALLPSFASDQGLLGRRYGVSMQNPLALRRHEEPQPDLALAEGPPSGHLPGPAGGRPCGGGCGHLPHLRPRAKAPTVRRGRHPRSVAGGSNDRYDRGVLGPGPTGYGRAARFGCEGRVVSDILPELAFDASEVLPPDE